MKLTQEKHRVILLKLLESMNFPGAAIDDLWELKQEIINAEVEQEKPAAEELSNG